MEVKKKEPDDIVIDDLIADDFLFATHVAEKTKKDEE